MCEHQLILVGLSILSEILDQLISLLNQWRSKVSLSSYTGED